MESTARLRIVATPAGSTAVTPRKSRVVVRDSTALDTFLARVDTAGGIIDQTANPSEYSMFTDVWGMLRETGLYQTSDVIHGLLGSQAACLLNWVSTDHTATQTGTVGWDILLGNRHIAADSSRTNHNLAIPSDDSTHYTRERCSVTIVMTETFTVNGTYLGANLSGGVTTMTVRSGGLTSNGRLNCATNVDTIILEDDGIGVIHLERYDGVQKFYFNGTLRTSKTVATTGRPASFVTGGNSAANVSGSSKFHRFGAAINDDGLIAEYSGVLRQTLLGIL